MKDNTFETNIYATNLVEFFLQNATNNLSDGAATSVKPMWLERSSTLNPYIALAKPAEINIIFHPFLGTTPKAMATLASVEDTTDRERKI
jgi:hypothetical protein